ncbi:flagellin [Psychrobacillus antarcticus]|uniref:flagellin N-terminal helical domain-containing protein n=1 Tax=Psychrobacillus antarcticus TaxID=2879115 RepID=UPI002408869F|nr:flagellin [Psychrobacillus antarcticus]
MRINHNIAALNTHRQLTTANSNQSKSMEKLSSGLRINKAGDDAAGLAISEKMRAQVRGLDMASKNAQDANSLIATAEGALNETHSILQRMRELAVQSGNDTNTDVDRGEIQKEMDQLTSEIDRIGNTTEFNTKKLINGGANVSATATDADTGDAALIKVLGGTGDTKVGASIGINTSTVATAATATATVATTGTALNAASAITINGTSFSFADAESTDNVIKAINDAGLGIKASLDATDMLVLTSNSVGSASEITIAGATGNFVGAATGSGTDATITAGTTANYNNYSAVGNTITIEDGDAKGLSFEISGALDVTADSTITVASNGTLNFQIGANEDQEMNISIGDMRASALGVSGIKVNSQSSASDAITTINKAIETVSAERSKLGAYTNRLDHTVNNLGTSSENLTAAESRIRDVDMAKEMMNQTKESILSQASQAMLAQANQKPQAVLQLLQ